MNDNAKALSVDAPSRDKLITTLQNSLYTGAKRDSVEMVISYCEAAQLDPMQKPVHIVPMNVRDASSGEYVWKDVIMPGIGLYRIQADRSGTLAGVSEPEFGDLITQAFVDKNGNEIQHSFPEWCKISVKKLIGNQIVEFVAKEYWLENYATAGRSATAPNAMWRKRPRGQIAKCAEAQALRKGWPEIGQSPTAEEMDGKIIDVEEAEVVNHEQPAELMYLEADFNKNFSAWASVIQSGKKTPDDIIAMVESKGKLTDEQKKQIRES